MKRKHGHASGGPTPTYQSWSHMLDRCTNPRSSKFANYGGRGITVCARWRDSFENFLSDMGERPTGTTIDRENNNGDYGPGNCRWATQRTQQRNRRDTSIDLVSEALILEMRRRGAGTADLAYAFGVSASTVQSAFAAAARRGSPVPALPVRMACKRGHRLEGANVRIRPDGYRVCRACKREREAV